MMSWFVISFKDESICIGISFLQYPTWSPLSSGWRHLRWLKTVSGTFQEIDFDGSLLPLFIN